MKRSNTTATTHKETAMRRNILDTSPQRGHLVLSYKMTKMATMNGDARSATAGIKGKTATGSTDGLI